LPARPQPPTLVTRGIVILTHAEAPSRKQSVMFNRAGTFAEITIGRLVAISARRNRRDYRNPISVRRSERRAGNSLELTRDPSSMRKLPSLSHLVHDLCAPALKSKESWMPRTRSPRCRLHVGVLERRLELSGTIPANSIGTSLGTVPQPRAVSASSVTIASNDREGALAARDKPDAGRSGPLRGPEEFRGIHPRGTHHDRGTHHSGQHRARRHSKGFYKWDGGGVATDAQGNFSVTETNTQGENTYNFLVIDPFGRQLIRSFPAYWIPFAAPGSRLV
jgi:hypothetical protein